MIFRNFKNLAKITFLSGVGGVAFYQMTDGHDRLFRKVHNSFTPGKITLQKWDDNWDFRAAASLIKPLKENATPEMENEYNKKLEKHTSKAVRHILLIRHGQYIYGDNDELRKLTELGREQATLTGKRINELAIPIDNIVVSTMTRAQETADLIIKQLPKKETIIKRDNCKMIEEGAVYPPSKKFVH